MEDKRGSIAVPAIIATIGLLIAMGIYATGYFALCCATNNVGSGRYRVYRTQVEAIIFTPAASTESLATGTKTRAGWLADPW